MRPNAGRIESELYECSSCGRRTTPPVAGPCEDCGGTFRNISRSRDL